MTRVWVAVGLLAVILTLAFTEVKLTKDSSEDILEILQQTEKSALNQSDNTEHLCKSMQKKWEKNKHNLQIFLSHPDIDDIDISLENLVRYSKQGDFAKVYIECGILENHINSLEDSERVTIYNLM